ncbi:MAG TPA: NADH-quinone oxidoreductase subunit J [Pyrinomonadaceae bacterium]|nr:NADH-quinone oxidoreductase subunit J [Pyrinomonadaceae bacterium]
MATTAFFFLFAGLAIACALSCVYHKNPLYSAVSLIGVFVSLSCLYITLAAPFIAAVQILVYAGAIMVLVVFVIMLLNLDDDKPLQRLNYLYGVGAGLGLILLVQTFFVFYAVLKAPNKPKAEDGIGKTMSIGTSMYTEYLLPVEIVGVLLLMAIIGGVILARRLSQPELELVVDNELEKRHEGKEDDFRIAM